MVHTALSAVFFMRNTYFCCTVATSLWCTITKKREENSLTDHTLHYTEGIGSSARYDFYQRSLVKVADRLHTSPPAHTCYTHCETMLSITCVQHSHANYIPGIRCENSVMQRLSDNVNPINSQIHRFSRSQDLLIFEVA